MKFTIGLIVLAGAILYGGWAEASSLRVEVEANPVISNDRVNLGDIAKITGGDEEVEKASSLFIMNLPSRVLSKSISKDMIVEILKKNRLKTDEMDFIAPAIVKISRKTMTVEAKSLEEMARAHLQEALKGKKGDITIKSLKAEGGDLSLPEGKLDVEFLPLNQSQLTGDVSIHANLLVDGRVVERVQINAEVEASVEVAVASRNIKKGDILAAEDFQMEKTEVHSGNSNFLFDPEDIIGKRALKSIAGDQPIQENMLDIPPLVNKKDRVKIVLESKFLKVSTVGVAQESGAQGSYIKVMNLDSEKIIVAKVIGENLVKVDY